MLAEQGEAFLALLCWVSCRRTHQEKVVIQENVRSFPVAILTDLLSDIYEIQHVIINPADHGFPSERPRQWIVMRHRTKTSSWGCPLTAWVQMFQSPTLFGLYATVEAWMPGWSIYFQNDETSASYLYADLLWAFSRSDSDGHGEGCSFKTLEEFKHALLHDYESVQKEFYRGLNQTEKDVLIEYKSLSPDMCYSLNQNPGFGATTSTWECLHTVIKNAGIIWKLVWNLAASNFTIVIFIIFNLPPTS